MRNTIKSSILIIIIAVFMLWQGSYFPLQFFLLITLALLALLVSKGKISLPIESVLFASVFLIFLISSIFFNQNTYVGIVELLRFSAFPILLIFFANVDSKIAKKSVWIGLLIIAVIGFLAYANIVYIPAGVISGNNRLQSSIQYANTTGLFMTIGVLYSIYYFRKEKRLMYIIYAGIFASALFLTGSRTSLVTAVVTGIIYILLNIKYTKKSVIILGASTSILILTVLFLEPTARILQISLTESTLVERWITFSDALNMLKDKWLTGIGIGNWQTEQYLYQTTPYSVKYIHNYFLQLFLDGGILAPLLFVSAIIPAILKGLRQKSIHACILIAVMFHSMLDIDLMFVGMVLITMFSLSQVCGRRIDLELGKLRYLSIAPLLLCLILWTAEAFSTVGEYQLEHRKFNQAMSSYQVSLYINPLNTDLYYQMAQCTQDKTLSEKLLRKAVESNPRYLHALIALTDLCASKGNYGDALTYGEQLLTFQPFSEDIRELCENIALSAKNEGFLTDAEYVERYSSLNNITRQLNPLHIKYINKNKLEGE